MIEMKPTIPSAEEMQQVYDLIIILCEHDDERRQPGAQALRTLNRLYDAVRAPRQNISDVLIEALEEVAAVNVCPPRDLNEAFAQREALRDVARAAIAKARGQ